MMFKRIQLIALISVSLISANVYAEELPTDTTLPPLSQTSPIKETNPAINTAPEGNNNTSSDNAETVVLYAGLRKTADLPIDLPTVLKLVDEQNLLIDNQFLNAAIQKNTMYRTMSDLLPDLQLNFSRTRSSGAFQIFGNQVLNFTQTRLNPSLNFSLPVYPGGKTVFQSIAAHRRFKSQASLLDSTRQEQLVGATKDYYRLIETSILYDNALKSIEEAASQVKLNESRLKAGVGTKLDLMQAQTNFALKGRLAIDARRNLAQAEQALLDRLNLDPYLHLNTANQQNIKTPIIPPDQDWDSLVRKTVQTHPDVKRLEFELKALKMDFMARASDVVPSFTLNFIPSYLGPTFDSLQSVKTTSIAFQSNITENAGFALPLDLRKIYLQLQQTKTQRDSTVRSLQTGIVNAKTDIDAADKAIEVAEYELTSSQEAYRLSSERYKVGLAIFLDVLTAQTSLTNARNQLASAISTYNQTQVQMLDALGEASPETILNGFSATALEDRQPDGYALKRKSGLSIQKPNAIQTLPLQPVTTPQPLPGNRQDVERLMQQAK